MAQARQQYVADWAYVDKQKKEFTLTDEIIEKLDSIEPSAERNAIQWVKVNGELQTPDQYRVVSLTIPEVVDNLDSYDNKSSLSARQGRVLAQQIKNLQSIWKFLSNWNSTTGLPTSNPSTIPYIYKPWDYYIVSIVGTANYRPEWTSFDWSSSSTLETELVDVWDIYMYDDEWWLLLHNSARVIAVDTSLSSSSTNPVENRVITQALNTKQEKIVAGANIQIAQDWKTISATDTTYSNLPAAQGWTADSLVTTGDKYNWNNKQSKLTAWANVQIAQDGTISATDTVYWAWANIQINWNIISATDTTYVAWDFDIKDLADSTGLRAEWSWKQDELIAWNNIQIAADWKTISATDTTYTAGTWINIDANNVISNTQTSAEWWNITWTLSDQTDLQNALDAKQDDMVILKYWISTWNDFITAYNKNWVIYCRASSNSNPASWSQTRLAFMAYVNNETTPTEVEFQYYRSRSSHSTAANVLDEVYVYKLVSTGGWTWSVTQRDIAAKPLAWTWIWLTYNASGMTISADTTVLATKTDLNSKQDTISDLATIRTGAWLWATALQPWDDVSELNNDAWYITNSYHDSTKQDTLVSGTNIKTVNNTSLLWSWNISINWILSGAIIPPASATYAGRIWFDTVNNKFWECDWTEWTEVTPILSVNWQTWNVTIETFQLAPNSPLAPKYRWYGTQAQYEALTQYYTDEEGDTVYFTI